MLWLLIGGLFMCTFASTAAHACSCAFSDETYSASELENEGVVILRGHAVTRTHSIVGFVYQFEVEQVLVGAVPDRVNIFAGRGGGDCGFEIPLGETRTLVARVSDSRVLQATKSEYSVDICSQSLRNRVRGVSYWLKKNI